MQPSSRLRPSILVATLLSCVLVWAEQAAPGRQVADRRDDQNVIVLLIDCLRADHVGAYGHPNPTTPNIDRLAADSVLFEQAIAQTNWTKPSVVSLFSSLYLSQHRVIEGPLRGRVNSSNVPSGHILVDEFTTMAEYFSGAGFMTGGFVNQAHMPDYLGFGQGFHSYYADLNDPDVQDNFFRWVGQLRDRRFFAYLHLLDLHFPYVPQDRFDLFTDDVPDKVIKRLMVSDPEGFRELVDRNQLTPQNIQELTGLYDGELLGVDDRVGALIRFLKAENLYDKSLVVLTADHGEAFLEHGYFEHGGDLLYSELIRVPLLVKFPDNEYAGKRVPSPVQLIDILPTLQEYFGIQRTGEIGGTSLMALTQGGTDSHLVLSEVGGRNGSVALYHDGYKFIFDMDTDAVEVFDYGQDPLDLVDLSGSVERSLIEQARVVLEERLRANEKYAAAVAVEERPLGPLEIDKLRALGYIR